MAKWLGHSQNSLEKRYKFMENSLEKRYKFMENSLEKRYKISRLYLLMFRRKLYTQMMEWKDSLPIRRQALVIKGLRQVGKTYLACRFAEDNYPNVVYINFKSSVSAKKAFDGDLDVDRIILYLSAQMPKARFIPHKTVIIFDEIQDCAEARASLKYLVEDGRFDIICTGSLLGIKGYNRKASRGISVGFEHTLYMKSLDFEEFLWAKGISEDVIACMSECVVNRKPVPEPIHEVMLRSYHEYMCVGGMPAVVKTFLATSDMNAVRTSQKDILESYRDDFAKHLNEEEFEETDRTLLNRINAVFDSIPMQLAKENKKFQYSQLGKSARGAQYMPAIQWLCDYGLVARCPRLNSMELPLEGNCDDSVFKLYFRDSGLFVSMLGGEAASSILYGNMGAYKGALYENIVADSFTKMDRRLFYYARDSGLEIDFITALSGKPVLIEVKSTTGNTKSAKEVLSHPEKYGVTRCIKLGEYNVGDDGCIMTLPYYAAFLLEKLEVSP